MNKYLLNTIGVALLGLIVIAGWAFYKFGALNQESIPVVSSAAPVVQKIGTVADNLSGSLVQINTALQTVNRPCNFKDSKLGLEPCGTLADFTKTLETVKKAVGEVEIAANHEDRNLGLIDSQERQLFADTHSAINNLIGLELTLNQTLQGIQPLEQKLGTELDAVQKTTLDIDALITDDQIIDLIRHADNTMGHIDGLSGDIQAKTHDLIYPAACQGKLCWVKRTYSIVHGVVQLGEPAYYWGALSTQILK